MIGCEDKSSLFRSRFIYTIATRHERQTCYYGSWLSLSNTYVGQNSIASLLNLHQPRDGYAHVDILNDWDPRNVGNFTIDLNTPRSSKKPPNNATGGYFSRIYESLEEVTYLPGLSVESHTQYVTQALNFVATGQPPEPERITSRESDEPQGSR